MGIRLPSRAMALWPWVGLALALGVTTGGWILVRKAERARIQSAFEAAVTTQVALISQRMTAEEQILKGAAEFASQKGEPTQSEWKNYVSALELSRHYPGIQGLGFLRWVPARGRKAHEQRMGALGVPGYRLRAAGDLPPDPEGFGALVLMEPLDDRNAQALGLEVWSEPIRRVALARARDLGTVVATGQIHLVQEDAPERQGGIILFAPVYRHGAPLGDVADRRRALIGWTSIPQRMDEHLQGTLGEMPEGLRIQVVEGSAPEGTFLFPARPALWAEAQKVWQGARLVRTRTLEVAGRSWVIRALADGRFTAIRGEGAHWTFLIGGLTASLLTFLLLGAMERSEIQAERLAAERLDQLISSEARYAAVIDSLSEGLLVFGEDGHIRACNPAAEAILGLSARDLIGAGPSGPGWRIVDGTGAPLTPEQHPVALAIRTGKPMTRAILGLTTPEGRFRWLQCSVTPILGTAEGKTFSVVATILDITEQRNAEAALRGAEKAESLGLMAAGIAHDFNNLFQALLGNLELAHLRSDPPGRQFIDRARTSLDKASGLSLRLLEFSGGSFTRLEPLSINPLIQEVADSHARGNGPGFHLALAPRLPEILADAQQIRQVMGILIENAVEAVGAEGGTVTVTSERIPGLSSGERAKGRWVGEIPVGPVVCVSISDTGGGAGPDVMDRLFDPFFSTKAMGRGLGLSSAQGLIRGNRAGMQALDRPGEGMTFRIFLAIERRSERRPGLPAARVVCGGGAVLVVDDEADLRQVMAEALRECHGCTVFEAADGVEAIEVFQAHRDEIGLVLMDSVMPRMKGPEAFDEIRRISPGIPGILISGFSEETGQTLAARHGFAAFLKKPFPLKDLSELMEEVQSRSGGGEDTPGNYS